MSSLRAAALEREQRGAAQAVVGRREALGLALADAPRAALEPAVRAFEPRVQLGEVGDDEAARDRRRRGAHVGGEIDERRVLLVPDRRDDRHRAGRDGAHEALVGEREQVLEAAAAAREHDHVGAAFAQLAERGRDLAGCARALHVRLGHEHVRRREARRDRREHVALGRRVVAGHEPDQARQPRQRPLPLRREQPLGRELRLQPLERRKVRAEAVALDRERAQVEVAALLVQLGPAVDVHALAVGEARAAARRTARAASAPRGTRRPRDP